jgi:hypothetical protein
MQNSLVRNIYLITGVKMRYVAKVTRVEEREMLITDWFQKIILTYI